MPPVDPSEWECDAVVADGGVVHLRLLGPDDLDALAAFSDQLEPETIYLRFFTYHRPDRDQLAKLVDLDHVHRVALACELDGTIIGVGRYTYEADRGSAEVAFVIDEEHQGRGIGTLLLEHLAAIARSNGIERFHAETMGGNRKMLRVFRNAGFEVGRELDDGFWDIEMVLDAAADEPISARERNADARSAARLLSPRVVAVVGASPTPGTVGNALFANLLQGGFAGTLHPVTPRVASVLGVKAYPTVGEIPDHVDLAVIAVPAAAVPGVVEECGEAGVASVVVISAGFAEVGDDGVQRQAELVTAARRHGMRVVGPNCMGIVNTAPGVSLNATFAPVRPPAGTVGFASQSGALGISILDRAERLGLGISSFVSLGNKADISGNDLLQYWEQDPHTSVALLYLESFGNPRKFSRIARRVSRTTPIVVVKSGRTDAGKRGARSHTAALASSDVVADTVFEQAGIVRVDTLEQLFDVARVLVHQPVPRGPRVAVVGNSGGPGILAADACVGAGLEVPELSATTQDALRSVLAPGAGVANPVDLIAAARGADYGAALELLLADDDIDSIIVIYTDPLVSDVREVAAAVTRAVAAGPDKPVVACFLGNDVGALLEPVPTPGDSEAPAPPRRIPVFPFPESPAVALARAARLGAWRERPVGVVPQLDGVDLAAVERTAADALGDRSEVWLSPSQLGELLAGVGVELVGSVVVTDPAEAEAAAAEVSGPVALKLVSSEVQHKSDVGGVILDLETPAAVSAAYRVLQHRLGELMDGAIVQPMAPPGVETIVGVVSEPSLGPLVMFGLGGTAVELLADRSFRLVPLTDVDVAELVRSPRAAPLLSGFRGATPVDVAALEDLISRISALADAVPELMELDLNPVVAHADGFSVVDGRCRLAARRGPRVPPVRRLDPPRGGPDHHVHEQAHEQARNQPHNQPHEQHV
ncbi:MAG: GNAT family N-acetyltransferase [Acidimicrobiales bacterium]|nr:GNAT family N-acetyltransferase [Acidimicrobiales bacterium]